MTVVFNEIDPFASAWLANLIETGELPAGKVDTRSIRDLKGKDCGETNHLFCGIGGWPLALRLAGWGERPIWSGSCPCQPYSAAGKGKGDEDERNLWPEMFRLIRECRPPICIGEQVASKDALRWVDGVRLDLENAGYAFGVADLCAASAGTQAEGWIVRGDQAAWERIIVGAPHIRQRLFWVAVADRGGCGQEWQRGRLPEVCRGAAVEWGETSESGSNGWMGHSSDARLQWSENGGGDSAAARQGSGSLQPERNGDAGGLGIADGQPGGQGGSLDGRGDCGSGTEPRPGPGGDGELGGLAESELRGRKGQDLPVRQPRQDETAPEYGGMPGWDAFLVIPCRDDKLRRISAKPGDVPLAHGIPNNLGPLKPILERMGHSPKDVKRLMRLARSLLGKARGNRVGRLRGFGNAIVSQAAVEFIRVVMEIIGES